MCTYFVVNALQFDHKCKCESHQLPLLTIIYHPMRCDTFDAIESTNPSLHLSSLLKNMSKNIIKLFYFCNSGCLCIKHKHKPRHTHQPLWKLGICVEKHDLFIYKNNRKFANILFISILSSVVRSTCSS